MSVTDYQLQWEIDNKEYRKTYKHEYYEKNKTKIRARNDTWKRANKERCDFLCRKYHLRRYYKLTPEQYDQIIKTQNNLCALCLKPLDPAIRNPVDHDHKCCQGEKSCGKCVRGVLHDRCNRYISLLEKYPELLPNALNYIKLDLSHLQPTL